MQISIKLYQVQIADSDSRCLSKQIDFPTTKTNFSYNNTQKSSTARQPSDNILQVPKATYQQSLHYSISVSEQPLQASLLIAWLQYSSRRSAAQTYHNCKVQRRSNQYYPQDEQPLCYFLFLNNFQAITFTKFKERMKTYLVFSYLLWATNLELMFIVSNQNIATQRMSNQYVYYSLWATTYFFLSSSLAN